MPMQSKAQNAAMHAAASGNSTIGIPKSVGQKFVSAQHGSPLKKGTPMHKTSKSLPPQKSSPFSLKKKAPPRPAKGQDDEEFFEGEA